MKKRCIIIAGSPVFSAVDTTPDDFVIAVDGGYKHALAAGISPDLLIGDFDSYSGEVKNGTKTIKAPAMKDDTDTMLAVKYALGQGYDNFVLLGATGGRFDHQTANISVCAYIAEHGGFCEMRDSENMVYAIKNSCILLEKKNGWSVSVFAYSEKASGVTVKGLKYPLVNATLTNTFPLGVSNEFAGDTAKIEVKEGILLIVMSEMSNRINIKN